LFGLTLGHAQSCCGGRYSQSYSLWAAAIRSLSTSLRQQLVPSLFRCYLATFYYRLNGSWLPGEINYDGQRLKSSQRYGHQRDCSVSLAPLNTQTVHLADGKQRPRGGVSDRRHLHPLRSTNPRNTIRYDTIRYEMLF